jgi:hypothetical protein
MWDGALRTMPVALTPLTDWCARAPGGVLVRLAVFGASGRTGRPLVERALAEGHTVRALVRTPTKVGIQDARLELIQGDATDAVSGSPHRAGR